MKNSILSRLLYKCKKFVEAFLLLFMLPICVHAQTSPDYIFGDDNGSGWNWTLGTHGASGLGSSYKWQFQATSNTNQYFKLGESSSSTDGQGFWKNNSTSNMQYTGGGAIWNSYYNANMGADGSIYFAISSGKCYVLKAKKDISNSNANFSIQELSATPISISGVSDNFTAAGNDMTVKITLSGSKSTEERIFVRYTTDNWTTSSVTSEATGSGTAYTATIPASGVTATTNNKYYVFTTTVASPSASDADLLAIAYNNNSGNYYQLFSKNMSITINDLQFGGTSGWMFTSNGSPFVQASFCSIDAPNYAYSFAEWNTSPGTNSNTLCTDGCTSATGTGVLTTTSCTAEQTNVLNSTTGVTLTLNRGTLTTFQHINTVNPGTDWKALGEAGDYRVYSGNGGYLKVGGVTKLAFTNFWFGGIVSYPTPVGANSGANVDGWAIIDAGNSDPVWVQEFDPYGTGHVELQGSSFSGVIQQCYGSYTWNMTLRTSLYQSFMYSSHTTGIGTDLNFSSGRVSFNFSSYSGGGPYGILDTVTVKYIKTTPSGSLPGTINRVAQVYWQLGTVLSSYNADITFDLADIGGITNTSELRLLKRENSSSAWAIVTGTTMPDATHIKATGVTSLSDWAIGTTGSDLLPVELVSFNYKTEKNKVVLNWKTATEINSYGFEIERSVKEENSDWVKIGFVSGSGNSNSPKLYNYTDEIRNNNTYSYRLKMVDIDGSFKYSNVIEVHFEAPLAYMLSQNYPNPFNPVTTIKFALPEAGKVSLKIFSLLGDEVAELVNEEKPTGFHQIEFDASKLSSGVYFYKIESNNFIQIKKMSVIK